MKRIHIENVSIMERMDKIKKANAVQHSEIKTYDSIHTYVFKRVSRRHSYISCGLFLLLGLPIISDHAAGA